MGARAPKGLVRVCGIEISSNYIDREAHILGYFVPQDVQLLRESLESMESSRRQRFPKMVDKLRGMGIDISKAELESALRGVASPGRPHLARILVERGVVADTREAFDLYLDKGRPAYVERNRISARDAIALLRSVGSVPVLAHPYSLEAADLKPVLDEMAHSGLLGVEVSYDYSHMNVRESEEDIAALAADLDLIGTGGSDYHGDSSSPELGSVTVPLDTVKKLREASGTLRSRA
jgi:predicted metal-dependent phosphoesterase TrpH